MFTPGVKFFEFDNKYIIRCLLLKYRLIFFTCLSVFDSPKGSSNTFKTRKNISLYFKRRHLIIYKYFSNSRLKFLNSFLKHATKLKFLKVENFKTLCCRYSVWSGIYKDFLLFFICNF